MKHGPAFTIDGLADLFIGVPHEQLRRIAARAAQIGIMAGPYRTPHKRVQIEALVREARQLIEEGVIERRRIHGAGPAPNRCPYCLNYFDPHAGANGHAMKTCGAPACLAAIRQNGEAEKLNGVVQTPERNCTASPRE